MSRGLLYILSRARSRSSRLLVRPLRLRERQRRPWQLHAHMYLARGLVINEANTGCYYWGHLAVIIFSLTE